MTADERAEGGRSRTRAASRPWLADRTARTAEGLRPSLRLSRFSDALLETGPSEAIRGIGAHLVPDGRRKARCKEPLCRARRVSSPARGFRPLALLKGRTIPGKEPGKA